MCVLFEGRDAAGKGGTIKRIVERTNPRVVRVVALDKPHREGAHPVVLPALRRGAARRAARSCCSTGPGTTGPASSASWGSAPTTSTRSSSGRAPSSSACSIRSGIILVKYWFSVSDEEQERRFQSRIKNPDKRWKLSPMDLRVPGPLGRLLAGQGRDVPVHRHQVVAVVGRRRRGQAAGPPQLHHPPAEPGPLRGPDVGAARSCRRARPTTTSDRRATTRRSCPRSGDAGRRS